MCGIAGIINFDGTPISARDLHGMNRAIRHRGPDDEGYLLIESPSGKVRELVDTDPDFIADIGLAHRRFSIFDLSKAGHQPFLDRDGAVAVVFNGAIYNYVELREQLEERGHSFESTSDTEVLVEAYKEWGTRCFERLNGMWAIALYDFKRHALLLCRDRAGKKPIYWTRTSNGVAFASEIKALLDIPEVSSRRRPNERAAKMFLADGSRDLINETCFEGIYSLPPATWTVVDSDFPTHMHYFWHLPTARLSEREISPDEAAEKVRDTLREAVRIRLRADVPWAIELSGGMDSSVLVALASELQDDAVRTYTVRFQDKGWNEEPWARAVAERFGTDYRVVDSPIDSFWHEILPFTYLQEEPYHAPNVHTIQVLRRQLRADGAKVVLNGAAGDELFAGYGSYFTAHQLESVLRGRVLHALKNGLNWSEGNLFRSFVEPAVLLARRLVGNLPRDPWLLTQRLTTDFLETKMPYWLRVGDKTHMGLPIEARNPFLDYRVVELASTLPTTYLIRDGWHKWILRRAFADLLPDDVVWRKQKMGFPFSYNRFYKDSAAIFETIVKNSSNPFTGRRAGDGARPDWRAISFTLWYELFFNNNKELFAKIASMAPAAPEAGYSEFIPEFLAGSLQVV